jgi:tetratricopeptide (TPR) repeat protein
LLFAESFSHSGGFLWKSHVWNCGQGNGGRMAKEGELFWFRSPIMGVAVMAFVSKWFGFGHDPAFDDGVRAFEKRSFQEAVGHFRESASGSADRALKDRAKSYLAGCLGKMARAQFDAREFDSARSFAREATDVRPQFADLWLLRARIEKALSQWDDARESVATALEINPNYGAALVLRGVLLLHVGETQTGFRSVQEGIKMDDRLIGMEWLEGEAAFRRGEFLDALSHFEQIEPRGSDIHDILSRGDELAKKGEWRAAANLYSAVTEIAPAYADVRIRHGQALLELGELDQANRAFQHAIAVNPEFAEAYALMGIVARRQDDEETAIAAFRKALDYDPQHPIASQEVLYRRKY